MDRPILFSGEMVRAILSGRKTMTRRPVTRPRMVGGDVVDPEFWEPKRPGVWQVYHPDLGETIEVPCPIALPSDLLYVRETFLVTNAGDAVYRADYPANAVDRGLENIPAESEVRWRPSIHMPRWAARIWLRVTCVRVERVQDISEADARAEGVELVNGHSERGAVWGRGPCYCEGFAQTWIDCYGRESWDANPWVWAISFERTEAPAREGGR